MTATTVPISIAWTTARSAAVGEEEHEADDQHGGDEEDEPQRRGDDAGRAVDPGARAASRSSRWSSHLE